MRDEEFERGEGSIGVEQVILRNDFVSFIEKCFYTLNPGREYQHNWHIEKIADALLDVSGGGQNLIINLPPRYLKSLIVNVAWPAWLLGHKPGYRIISASHNQKLAEKHSDDCRKIIKSDWYKKVFPATKIQRGADRKAKFQTTKNGFRLATSVNTSVIGEGGDVLIIDDPQTPFTVSQKNRRKKLLEWFEQSFMTRLDSKKSGAIVLVMQRLHKDDLCGCLWQRGGWNNLIIPAIKGGEPLHETRDSFEALQKVKREMGEVNFAAQYMQKPIAHSSGMVKENWFGVYSNAPQFSKTYLSFDTAIKSKSSADYSVGMVIGEFENNFYIIDIWRDKVEYPELRKVVLQMSEIHKPDTVLVEDKASGQSLLQDLRRETKLPLIALNPKGDKITRFASVTPMLEAGKVNLPSWASWLRDFKDEVLSFPDSVNDDQVDALTQFLIWMRNRNETEFKIRKI